ncbi:MAG: sensor histidine kinase, partial [Acidimicrobiia bacterium]
AQTIHPEDVFGKVVHDEELPIIERAFLEERTWQRDEPLLIDGVEVRMEAIPVPHNGRVLAVITKEGAPLRYRRPGRLEENYLECAAAITKMVEEGNFPFTGEEADAELAPRVGDGLVRLDSEGRVLYASPNAISAFRRLGIVSYIVGEEVGGLDIDARPARDALSLGRPAEGDIEVGGTVVHQRVIPFIEGHGRSVFGAMVLVRDVTELRHRERVIQRKEAVIREVHHRVKNNLQTIASLLRLQARRLDSAEARRELEEAVRRIASIAVVHETLTRESTESVEFGKVAGALIEMVRDGLTHPERKIEISASGDPGELPPELATPLAVALVELLQNAVEHAFDGAGGTVEVAMEHTLTGTKLIVEDDGKGVPDKIGTSGEGGGLGLQIVKALLEELSGDFRIERATDSGGTRVTLVIPIRFIGDARPPHEPE